MKFVKPFFVVLILFFLFLATSEKVAHANSILYTKPSATGTGDCSSWDNACTVQTALSNALPGDEIWVMEGVHPPGTLRTDTFQLVSNVAIYGGFSGTENNREERNSDPATNNTVFSGEIGTAALTDNTYHVVTGAEDAIIDGFTITAGYADTYPDNHGGGMYNSASSLILTNIIFSYNTAASYGGGMFNSYESSPTLTNVTFSQNAAYQKGGGMYNVANYDISSNNVTFSLNWASASGGGMYNEFSYLEITNVTFDRNSAEFGGGMYNYFGGPQLTDATFSQNSAWNSCAGMANYNSSPVLTKVTFSKNESTEDGGGMCNISRSHATLTNVTFSENSAGQNGGGMNNLTSNPDLTNVTFSKNLAGYSGGGMYTMDGLPSLENVTFSGNSASLNGGGMLTAGSNLSLNHVTFSENSATLSGGGMYNEFANPSLTNVILWGNTAATANEIYDNSSTPVIRHSVIEGGYAGGANIITDDPILGTLTDYGGAGMQIFPLGDGSSAINTGDAAFCPEKDQRGLTRPQGAGCDVGAFEKGPPSNDDLSSPMEIITSGYQDMLSTLIATSAANDPDLPEKCEINGTGQATVWYTYAATSNTAIALDTYSADYDTFIAVWAGTYPNLNLVACNNDASGTKQSQVAFQISNGETYYIEIGQP